MGCCGGCSGEEHVPVKTETEEQHEPAEQKTAKDYFNALSTIIKTRLLLSVCY